MKAFKYGGILFFVYLTINTGISHNGSIKNPQSFDDTRNEEFVEELMYFFQKGEEKIELRANTTDAVIILGAGEVGKTTLGYVVAGNEENPLFVVCNQNVYNCRIEDRNGYIGNDSDISKTWIPHLIFDDTTNTAFYDCPGFYDNRNVTLEISNSYFMNLVANHAQRLKIFVVALSEDFSPAYRSRILQLFSDLTDIFPNLELFSDSFTLIGNQADTIQTPDSIIYSRMKRFLDVDLREIFGYIEDPEWPNEKIQRAISLFDSLVTTDENNTRLWHYPIPDFLVDEPTPITSFTKLMQGRDIIKRIISDRTRYYAPNDNDFNFPLSGYAKDMSSIALALFRLQMQQAWDALFHSVQNHLEILSYEILSNNYENINLFFYISESFLRTSYPRFEQYGANYYKFYKHCALLSEPFLKAEDKISFENSTKFARYLDFLSKASSELIYPDEWFRRDSEIKSVTILLVESVKMHLNPNCTYI